MWPFTAGRGWRVSNYAVTGHLDAAANSLMRAANSMPSHSTDFREAKLFARIVRLMKSAEAAEKAAKKLIPGGFVAVANQREEDKREQLARFGKGGAA